MSETAVAIVGMAICAPGAGNLEQFWTNVRDGIDAIGPVPPDRIPTEFYEPVLAGGPGPDELAPLSTRRGGFIEAGIDIDVAGLGVPPNSARAIEPDQLIALTVASQAMRDAGIEREALDPGRVSVILGRGGYPASAAIRFSNRVRLTRQVARALRQVVPGMSEVEREQALRAVVEAAASGPGTDVIGLVPNLCASRVANRLNFQGPAYTVDGACASSLLAIDQGISELARGRCDVVLAGGVHHCQEPSFWSVFTELGALSTTGQISPFDSRADGTLIGEATGIVVLKRAEDAVRDGDRVYAVIRGTGVTSDGRASSLVNPNSASQQRAVEQAWHLAGADPTAPGAIGMLEGHGTATPTGDAAELQTIRAVFGARQSGEGTPVIGTVKSMIGHSMPASGVVGVIKAALALHHRTLPPTLHCEQPHELLVGSRFTPAGVASPWHHEATGPRRAGVNAFGFGGINVHVVLEGVDDEVESSRGSTRAAALPSLERQLTCATGGSAQEALDRGRAAMAGTSRATMDEGPYRVALRGISPARSRLVEHRVRLGESFISSDDVVLSALAGQDRAAQVAFIFPGTEAVLIGDKHEASHEALGSAVKSLFRAGLDWDRRLRRAGLIPDVVAGVSMGEVGALASAGVIDSDPVLAMLDVMPWGALRQASQTCAVLGASAERVRGKLQGTSVVLTHDNSPSQCIISGEPGPVRQVLARLLVDGIAGHIVPLPAMFHQTSAELVVEKLMDAVPLTAFRPSHTPTWSGSTAARYPEDAQSVRGVALGQLARPVRLRELVQALYERGVRAFVSLGPGNTHVLISQTLADRPHVSVAVGDGRGVEAAQVRWVASALWAAGVCAVPTLPTSDVTSVSGVDDGMRVELALGAPLLAIDYDADIPAPVAMALAPTVTAALPTVVENRDSEPSLWSGMVQHHESADFTVPVSTATMPFLQDHCFFHQRRDWPDEADRWPVMPGTTILHLFGEAARSLEPGCRSVVVSDLRLRDWLVASPANTVTLAARREATQTYRMQLGQYASATVHLADRWPHSPAAQSGSWPDEQASSLTMDQIYAGRTLFHGPSFQGIARIDAMGPRHVRGVLISSSVPGALLDSAGQLFGCWLIAQTDRDNRMLPVGIREARFYGPLPEPGRQVDCVVRVVECGSEVVTADITLSVDGRVVVAMDGWTDRRFANDPRTQAAETWPEYRAVSQLTQHGWVLTRETWPDLPSRLLVMRNHLGSAEREQYERVLPNRRRQWLLGRIAVKDAVRYLLWSRGEREVFPAEIVVDNEPSGRPQVHGLHGRSLDGVQVSVSHSGKLAVATARMAHAGIGIDIESVRGMASGAATLAFTARERQLAASVSTRFGLPEDLVGTAFWSAKESVGKAIGTGVPDPRQLVVLEIDPERKVIAVSGADGVRDVGWAVLPDGDSQAVVTWTL
jgi:3-oxoacyl-(acyl-carrier-protein) synthase/phosphopantetheinyl transferase